MPDRHADLVEQTRQLLEPGDIDLVGVIVRTDLTPADELALTDLTVELGERIASELVDEATYIYSGTDDPSFGINQHQCLTLSDDAFVWECQQVLRGGTFDIVYYYERSDAHADVLDALRGPDRVVIDVSPAR